MSVIDILAKIGLAAIGLVVCFIIFRVALNIGQALKFEFSESKEKNGLQDTLTSIFVSALVLGGICFGIYSYFT